MIAIVAIAKFIFDSTVGRTLIAVAAAGVLFGSWLFTHDNKVRATQTVEINQAAEKIGEKAVENRKRADVPDAAERLRKRSCRDS